MIRHHSYILLFDCRAHISAYFEVLLFYEKFVLLYYLSYECFTARVDALETCTIKQVACGQMHTLAVTDKGFVFAWGDNMTGQLGLGNMQKNAQRHPRCCHLCSICLYTTFFVIC